MIEEPTFLERTRPWPHYARDYRPVIEFAKANSLIVLAANAPADLVKKARKEGLAAVAGERTVAREVSAPEDDGYDAFVEMMAGHPGVTDDMMKSFYAAQCVRDDTMAETITDYLGGRYAVDDRPLAVLICGQGHSDHGRGTVRRIESRMPDIDVRVVSAEAVEDPTTGLYESPRDVADYVVVVPRKAAAAMPAASKPAASKPTAGAKPAEPAAGSEPTENPEGLRPALGFMPDYDGDEDGVLVGTVFPDRPAARAGIEAGDVIVALGGIPTPDVDVYTEVLDAQIIGRTIKVRVRRELAEVDLEVEVGSRQR
jgi:hypothetical protein